jgi:hypothetical protein
MQIQSLNKTEENTEFFDCKFYPFTEHGIDPVFAVVGRAEVGDSWARVCVGERVCEREVVKAMLTLGLCRLSCADRQRPRIQDSRSLLGSTTKTYVCSKP